MWWIDDSDEGAKVASTIYQRKEGESHFVGGRANARLGKTLLIGVLLSAMVGAAAAGDETSMPAPVTPADTSLTFNGIMLYGTIDVGLQYESHSAPINDYYVAGTASFIRPNSNGVVTGVTPSNLSQSKVGLTGKEILFGDWLGVFRLETYFNPQSGNISDCLRALVANNGLPVTAQQTALDSSIAGQTFQMSTIGLSSVTYGTLTFGRQPTLLADGIAQYDPQRGSLAFSLIGAQGFAAGGGDTEDRRLNSSLKYVSQLSQVHVGAEYKFSGSSGRANSAIQAKVGAKLGAGSVDVFYSNVRDAIALSSLTASQVSSLPKLGFSSESALSGIVSDNTTYGAMAFYDWGSPKLYAGYEYIHFANPATPLAAGFVDIGGYVMAFANNTAYNVNRDLQVFWVGGRYAVSRNVDLAAAYYGYRQNSYATGTHAGCSNDAVSGCSGEQEAISASADYRFSKHFDTYAGLMYSAVKNGFSSGYLHNTNVATTLGARYQF